VTIRIVTDSACDLPDEVVRAHGIEVVPLTITFGDEALVDREQLSVDDFWTRLLAMKGVPQTAAPSIGAFEAAYRKLIAEGATGIVCVNLASALSATMQSAELAARSVTDVPIEVIDSESATIGVGLMAVAAARLAEQGADLATVATAVRSQVARTRLFGALDTLEFLKRGGRVGAAKALLGEVLSVKPCITVRGGKIDEAGKVRTRSKALAWLLAALDEAKDPELLMVFHGLADDAPEFTAKVQERFPDVELITGILGPVVGTHTGPRAIGVGWVERA
jgi:DegV family protein with EDD domain